ncbi:TetR/AcrR family transcriptional regulator C-terminal domain-containing protein [Streptomyces sp. NPDC056987]|uniref:TetR/AcrR family transcriptional regulator C-terminal domain-containing protein n=1 Tax=Streptomyces sp. NPDC056987 TaxID=3345988 RepID=UPI00362D9EE3
MTRDGGPGAGGIDPQRLWLASTQPRRGRRPAHSREAITAAAVALADAEGLEAVTMRRVASQVGVSVMSLYSYAPDKGTLLELMVDHVSGELRTGTERRTGGEPLTDGEPPADAELPTDGEPPTDTERPSNSAPLTVPAPTGDWRADLKAIGHLQRALMLRHPWLPAALSTRRAPGPHTLAFLEHALAVLRPTGLDGAAKLEIFAQLTSFVAAHVGHELAQAATARSPDRLAAEARYLAAVAADGHHPELAEALAAPGRSLTPEATFTRFLNRLTGGLDSAAEHPEQS